MLGVRGCRRPAQVQLLLQHLLPELRHLRLAVLLLLPQAPLPRQPLLLLVGALQEQGRGRAAARQREEPVAGEEAGRRVGRGGRRVQGVLHRLGHLQARVLQLVCGRGGPSGRGGVLALGSARPSLEKGAPFPVRPGQEQQDAAAPRGSRLI